MHRVIPTSRRPHLGAIYSKIGLKLQKIPIMAVKKQYSSFAQLLAESPTPLLVDFYATWCGPCQMMSPILEQVKAQFGEQLQIVKIDTDKYPAIASEYRIEALPTLVVFKNGQPVDRIEGVLNAEQLSARIQPSL